MGWFSDIVFRLGLSYRGGKAYKALQRAAASPQAAQVHALKRILRANRGTAFAADHGFSGIRTIDDFRARVPLSTYEDLRPYIDRQIAGERAIVSEKPLMYARTSGTLSAPKLIPITPSALKRVVKVQAAMAYAYLQACDMYSGKILLLSGATHEDSLGDGTPIGSVTGLIYETMPKAIRQKYVVPAEVFSIDNAALKYAIVAHLALKHENLTAVSTANPSTFLRLRDYFQQNWAQMIVDVRRGHLDGIESLPPAIYRAVKRAISPATKRAAHLDHLSQIDQTSIHDLWPNLKGVVTWTGGSCAIAAQAVRRAIHVDTRLIEAGYVASELRGTAVLDVTRNLALPLLEDVFFEFIPSAEWDEGRRSTLLVHELVEGKDYQVIVTTLNGLYRYVMNDILQAGPRIGRTVSLSFKQKGKGFTSITGEKLSEQQVNEAMARLGEAVAGEIRFYVVLADEEAAGYMAYLHVHQEDGDVPLSKADLSQRIDQLLCSMNIEYAAKRQTGRLAPLKVHFLKPETALSYRDFHIARGQREAQFKVMTLQYRRESAFDFAAFVEA
ncbi:hypothetical protein MMA231_01596 [Asticcacaulis sp. MM231]|uniref:GH3 auxin-responsive promoter family protein n=1 Tax=Asticcacaulis sp. MM231 TaxID=3157666 RepID=UPI0032D58E20